MKTFLYQAVDPHGRLHQGNIVAEEISDANKQLHLRNLNPVLIQPVLAPRQKSLSQILEQKRRVTTHDLILYTKQLVTMIRVGIPISEGLTILQDQTEHPRLQKVSRDLRFDVQDGLSFSEALEKHPKIFSELYCTIVTAGEKSGTLPAAMDRLLYLIEHEASVKAEVKAALRYPLMVVAALVVAFVIMLGFVIPSFASFFDRAGLELPLPTKICLQLSAFLTSHGWLLGIALLAAIFLARFALGLPGAKLWRDTFLLRIPIIGPVLVKSAMSRFASVFAILQSSGIMVLEALDILSQSIGNSAISTQFLRLRESLKEGQGISVPLRAARYFPPLLVSMVAIGEETGRLDEMLRNISAHYDMELRHNIKKMTDSIGPILIVALLVIIGFFALAIYLPMWDLAQMAK